MLIGAPMLAGCGSTFPLFTNAAGMLTELARQPESAIPDGILNRTYCVAVFPKPGSERVRRGAASCRVHADSWSRPATVRFDGSPRGDLLVLVMSPAAADRMKKGRLELSGPPQQRAGILERQVALVTDRELSEDVLTYVRRDQQLTGAEERGAITAESGAAKDLSEPNTEGGPAGVFLVAVVSYFNTITPTGIILHHSATIPETGKVPADPAQVDEYHAARGMSITCFGQVYHIAYHFLIEPDGKVIAGRPERCAGAHARGYNSYLGISLVGDFSSVDNPRGKLGPARPTSAQMHSLVALCRRLQRQYDIPLQRVLRHSDVSRTRCPGDRFPFARLLRSLQ